MSPVGLDDGIKKGTYVKGADLILSVEFNRRVMSS
jgi:hypothetical protein